MYGGVYMVVKLCIWWCVYVGEIVLCVCVCTYCVSSCRRAIMYFGITQSDDSVANNMSA